VRKRHPDHHKDFYFEIFDDDESTGEEFVCSVKTRENLKEKNNFALHSIDTKALKYYFDKARPPVFLILIDLPKNCAYYAFLQEYLVEYPEKKHGEIGNRSL
jgi:hypothetical protein